MMQKSSLRFWIDVQLSGSSPENKRMPENEYACCGGGFPLTVKNAGVIGTICVSGLPQYRKLRGLLLTKDAHELYEKFGFETVKDRAMVKVPEI